MSATPLHQATHVDHARFSNQGAGWRTAYDLGGFTEGLGNLDPKLSH